MAILDILEFPDTRLRKVAKPVNQVTDEERELAASMLETMYAAPGIGLAATQVNQHIRLLVMDVSDNQDEPLVFINPEIVDRDGEQVCEEGCLSVPGLTADVARSERVRVRALNTDGEAFEMEVDGIKAVCLQHEMDHLDGKLFVDYLSPLKRRMLEKRLRKQRRTDSQPEAVR